MAKQSQQRKNNARPPSEPRREARAADSPATASSVVPDSYYIAGIIFLAIAIFCTVMLVLSHVKGISLPGCQKGGACDQVAAGPWGKVPRTQWPISFVGLAYFSGLLLAWLGSKGGIAAPLRYLVRLGVLCSVLYSIVLIVEQKFCVYCVGTHLANFAFWIILEKCGSTPLSIWRPVATVGVVFLLASAALGAIRERETKITQQSQEKQLADSTKEIIKSSTGGNPADSTSTESTAVTSAAAVNRPWKGGFTGRYLRGPKMAPIRIVILTDYQCPDCYISENDIHSVLQRRPEVSLSVKHFPMCADCNPNFKENNMHPNACWAARAAETAGVLRGNDGFWQMHDWLFRNKGGFTNEQFSAGLKELGYSPEEEKQFNTTMMSQAMLNLVKSDIQEGIWLGLHYTPMIFINGVELKGVFAPQAVTRAVEALAATNPPALTAELDQPPPASEKYIADWRDNEFKFSGEDRFPWPLGPEGAALHIAVWGDYQEPHTAKADEMIRRFIANRKDAQYVFRNYPVNQACNPSSGVTKHEHACRAHQAAEAAGLLGGVDGFWKMHDWLMKHQTDFSEDTLRKAVEAMGFPLEPFFVTMDSPEVREHIIEDCNYGKQLGLFAVPCIFVNGKYVPRWQVSGEDVLERIMTEAARSPVTAAPQQAQK
jgi:protein-disulfide isomerase/uncharacterized membrane protein